MKELYDPRVFEPYGFGIHYDIPAEKYHAVRAVSRSGIMNALVSPRHFKYFLSHSQKETEAMRWGRIVHCAIFEPDVFKDTHVFCEAPDRRCKEYKAAVKDHPGKTVLTISEVEKITAMVESIKLDDHNWRLIQNGATEVTLFARCPATGLMLKARVDFESLTLPYLLDYKTTTDARPAVGTKDTMSARYSKFERHAAELGYHLQGEFYLRMYALCGKKKKFFNILAQEKLPPYAAASYVYGFEALEQAGPRIDYALALINNCIQTDTWPGYSGRTEVLSLPHWEFEDEPTEEAVSENEVAL